ncbi:unnamed protein product [Rodentolepis nana]|uniref:Uncharacterized protein n=1 Tax=Rodentolepis nana TaxID=102285 RepID=A0A3P7VA95_RODNA|nr:unnamed protein product [Rodentolepis nana]
MERFKWRRRWWNLRRWRISCCSSSLVSPRL